MAGWALLRIQPLDSECFHENGGTKHLLPPLVSDYIPLFHFAAKSLKKSSMLILFYFFPLSLRLLPLRSIEIAHGNDMDIAETNTWSSVLILHDFSAAFDATDHCLFLDTLSPLGFWDITYSYSTGCSFSSFFGFLLLFFPSS